MVNPDERLDQAMSTRMPRPTALKWSVKYSRSWPCDVCHVTEVSPIPTAQFVGYSARHVSAA